MRPLIGSIGLVIALTAGAGASECAFRAPDGTAVEILEEADPQRLRFASASGVTECVLAPDLDLDGTSDYSCPGKTGQFTLDNSAPGPTVFVIDGVRYSWGCTKP